MYEVNDLPTEASSKKRTIVTPWKCLKEFNEVYNWLFAETATTETKHLALRQMRVWALRRNELCPAAVLATTAIIKVQLLDEENDYVENLDVQYASAFTRFFNFMSSIMQTHNMRTMYETAQELGLQSFVVDLRHICAHGQELPPLNTLRNTANYCLEWLQEFYWRKQSTLLTALNGNQIGSCDKTKFDINVSTLFMIYDAALECYLKGAHTYKCCKRFIHGKRKDALLKFYVKRNSLNLRELFDVVLKELNVLVRRETTAIKDIFEIYKEALFKMKYFFNEAIKHTKTNEGLELLIDAVQNLFRMLAVQGYIQDIFDSLLEYAENKNGNEMKRAGVSFWATELAKSFLVLRKIKQMHKKKLDMNKNLKQIDFAHLNTSKFSKPLRTLLKQAGVDVKRTILFADTAHKPSAFVYETEYVKKHLLAANKYTLPILKILLYLADPEISAHKIDILQSVLEICFGQTETKVAAYHVTESDLKQILENDEYNEMVDKQYGIWKAMSADEFDWSACPLGRLPWE